MCAWKRVVVALGLFLVFIELAAQAQQAAGDRLERKLDELMRLVTEQQGQLDRQASEIRELKSRLVEQQKYAEATRTDLSSFRGPRALHAAGAAEGEGVTAQSGAQEQAPAAFAAELQAKTQKLEKEVGSLRQLLGRVRFGGSFRLRFDQVTRHSGPGLADALNNSRGRFRARLDFHVPIHNRIDVDGQLASGGVNDPISDDQDFTSFGFKNPFFLSRMYVTYRPAAWLRLRGGRIPEIFGDGSQFVFDPDLNFGGTSQEFHWDLKKHTGGRITALEARAAQYILNHANRNQARDTILFAQGARIEFAPAGPVRLSLLANFFAVRRPDAVAVAQQNFAAAARTGPFPAEFFGPGFRGFGLSTPALGFTGNRVVLRSPGDPTSAEFVATGFNTGELGVSLDHRGPQAHPHLGFGVQVRAARNFSSSAFRDGSYVRAYLGRLEQPRDWRLSYTYTRKQPDVFLAPFSDSDLGTISGTNIRTHQMEIDYKISGHLTYQNLFYVIKPFATLSGLAVNTPPQKRTFRFQSQMLFSF